MSMALISDCFTSIVVHHLICWVMGLCFVEYIMYLEVGVFGTTVPAQKDMKGKRLIYKHTAKMPWAKIGDIMDNRNFRNEIGAISPVIGIVLMVAITVILAVVIGSYVFGSAVNVEKSYIVGTSVERVTADDVRVLVHGGLDANKLRYINVSIDGNEFRRADVNDTTADIYPVTGSFPVLGPLRIVDGTDWHASDAECHDAVPGTQLCGHGSDFYGWYGAGHSGRVCVMCPSGGIHAGTRHICRPGDGEKSVVCQSEIVNGNKRVRAIISTMTVVPNGCSSE